ncbi:MAG: hypothetical protein WB523_16650 [Candidatus Sulfotelmatobacter sp.]
MGRPRSGDWNPTDIAAKMRFHRKAVSVGKKLRGKAFSHQEYREYLIYETQKAQRRVDVLGDERWSWLPELLTMIGIDREEALWVGAYGHFEPTMRVDLVTVHAAWKRAASRLHPDRDGGDATKMTRLNELWSKYETAIQAGTLEFRPAPVPEPVTKSKKSRRKKTSEPIAVTKPTPCVVCGNPMENGRCRFINHKQGASA